ncbi:hypothetical protein EIN_180830, partial [Entamoeba invadens IP1]|uniref:hypothetical protein n=1 Tax=Entamoeba invadens IP1 TaxID=370355 RepID=UPI0002C3DAE9
MLLLAVLFTLSLAQYDCTSAVEAALPSFEKTFSFSASTPTSKISPDAGSIHTVQAYYIKVTHVDDPASLIMQMSSCFNDNTLDADIDIYSVCDTNIAQNRIYSSGISTQCSGKTESPYLLWESNKGNTYYVVVKTRDVNQVGTVHLSNQVSVDTNTNYECNVATDISAFPFTQKGYLSGSIPVMKVECTEPYPMLWYKMKGDGKYYVAHTCSPYTNIDTAIVLVTSLNAGSCKNSKCAKQADDGCSADSLSTILSFKSEVDVDYYIGVYSINGVYGQFQLHIDSLQDSIPAVCEHALPIQKLPFAKTVNVVEAWPYTDAGCTRFPEKYRSVFLTIVGEGKEMVISTCKSLDAQLNTIGVGVEVLSSCDGMQCDMSNSEYGECYTNNYLIKTLTKGQTYIIHAFCKDGPCELTLNVYVKPDDHSDCEHAMVLVDPGQ